MIVTSRSRCRLLGFAIACLAVGSATTAWSQSVNAILENLFVEQEVPLTSVTVTDDIANGDWTFSETGMNAFSVDFNNNRHEFFFSDDGVNPLTVDGDTPWSVAFDIRLDATLVSPRKAFNFVVFGDTNSSVNLTTNRSPQGAVGLSDPPGESAMFGGQYSFLRTVGPADGSPDLNLNPSVGYVAGDAVRLEIHHTPSPDGGVTPSTVEHIYDDGTGTYTSGPRDLRNSGVFDDGARLGFILQGIAHSGTPTDSYAVNISGFEAIIGEQTLAGDYNADGVVDAVDYTVWRDDGSPDSSSTGYDVWAANYGASLPANASAIPEPGSVTLGLILCFCSSAIRLRLE